MTIADFLNSFFPEGGGWVIRYLLLLILCFAISSHNHSENNFIDDSDKD